MQVILQAALDELFTFEDPAKRIGAMFLFKAILEKVKSTNPSEHAAFLITLKNDARVNSEVAKATEEMAIAKDALDYWGSVSS